MSKKTITIHLNDQEKRTFEEYSKLHNIPLSTLFKRSLEEKIKEELDMTIIQKYEDTIENDDVVYYSHDDVKDMLGL